MVNVRYTFFEGPFPPERWERLLGKLPESMREEILRYRRWEDRHARLLSRLLLLDGLVEAGEARDCLERVRKDSLGRPFLPGGPDFNLSHSGNWVACAVSRRGKVGIDVEALRPLDLEDFRRIMTIEEWEAVTRSPDPPRAFYAYWTIKESVSKADGRGLSLPLQRIAIRGDRALVDGTEYLVTPLALCDQVACHLAVCRSDHANPLVIRHLCWSDHDGHEGRSPGAPCGCDVPPGIRCAGGSDPKSPDPPPGEAFPAP